MAFSFRRMLSNISYFTKPHDENEPPSQVGTFCGEVGPRRRHTTFSCSEDANNQNYERTEPDSTSKQVKLPESVRNFGAKKGSFSDTDILAVNTDKKKGRCKKLKLDIKKASQSMVESLNRSDNDSSNVENTPKHILLNCRSAEVFSERLKKFDFDRSFDISDTTSEASYTEENIDLDSITDNTDTEVSGDEIKMCRKVDGPPSATPESFGDVEDKNEEERMNLLLNYQMKLEKIESFLQNLLSEFQFHIEVSKIFNTKSIVASLPPDVKAPALDEHNTISRGISPWNIIMEKEDQQSKKKLKKQLLSMKESIDNFIKVHFQREDQPRRFLRRHRSITFDLHKGQRIHRQNKVSDKKKMKHYDFPDLREAMVNLFSTKEDLSLNITPFPSDCEDMSSPKCTCKCHMSQTGSETPVETNQSISSSLGNFTLDSTTLSAYSDTLEEMSYNSFQDSSLYSTLIDKSAVERLTFYIQVHSIQINCELNYGFESKNNIIFHCPSCKLSLNDEYDLLRHILSQKHCEKIHFLYKTAYIKKCVATGNEIMPSTVLNPMTMYRDDNKIVCFGDAVYACSLCFDNFIVGESVLMAHCSDKLHVSRRERLAEYFE